MSNLNELFKDKKTRDEAIQLLVGTDEFKAAISSEMKEQGRIQVEINSDIRRNDPIGIYELVEKDIKSGKCKDHKDWKSAGGKTYQQMIDASLRLDEMLKNNGRVASAPGRKVTFGDAAMSMDMPILFPKVISNVVVESMEPESNILGLYEQISFSAGTTLQVPVMGAASGRNLDVSEAGEYNELTTEFAGFITAIIGKQGIKVSVTDEVIRYSVIDIYNLYLRHAGVALGRWKEKQAVDNLLNATNGGTLYDNIDAPGGSLFGMTTGRDANGYLNGTFTGFDLFDTVAYASTQGYTVDTIIMHPLAWRIFANDPVLRAFSFDTQQSIWKKWDNGSHGRFDTGKGGLMKVFPVVSNNTATTRNSTPKSVDHPFNVFVTPYMPIRQSNVTWQNGSAQNKYITDIIIADRNDIGLYVVDEALHSDSMKDVLHDIQTTILKERYGFGTNNLGLGVYKVANVVVQEGYDFTSQPIVRQLASIAPFTDGTSEIVAP